MFKKLLLVLTILLVAGTAGTAAATSPLATPVDDRTTVVSANHTSNATSNEFANTSANESTTANVQEDTVITDAPEEKPFVFSIESVEDCGLNCRDVTLTLENNRSTNASNITVESTIYAGNGTDGQAIWEETETVESLGPDESVTRTERVELSLFDLVAVNQEDGWITIETTVHSTDENMTIVERHDAV